MTGGFETSRWTEEETNLRGGLLVVHPTVSGTFALTGGVIDGQTAEPIVGARVVLKTSGGETVNTRTDGDGAFAFIDVPVDRRGEQTVVAVRADGYEPHRMVESYHPGPWAVTVRVEGSS